MNRAVFLDKDGTINTDHGYVYKTEDFNFLPGSIDAILRLNQAGFLVIVVSNQSGVARGYYSEKDIEVLHKHINDQLNSRGAHIDAFYYCPHLYPDGIPPYNVKCDCRKPETGMVEKAIADFGIDRAESYMIGDKEIDVELGRRARLKGSFKISESYTLLDCVKQILGNG